MSTMLRKQLLFILSVGALLIFLYANLHLLSIWSKKNDDSLRLVTTITQGSFDRGISILNMLKRSGYGVSVYGILLRRDQMRKLEEMEGEFIDVRSLSFKTNWDPHEWFGLLSSNPKENEFSHDVLTTHVHSEDLNPKWYHLWQFLAIRESLSRYPRILFFDAFYNVSMANWQQLDEAIISHGYYFLDTNSRHGECSLLMQGYNRGSKAVQYILSPLSDCILDKDCYNNLWTSSISHSFLPNTGNGTDFLCMDNEKGLFLEKEKKEEEKKEEEKKEEEKKEEEKKEEEVVTVQQQPDGSYTGPIKSKGESVIAIALLVPSVSRGPTPITSLPIHTILLNSFKTTQPPPMEGYRFVVYLGYDPDDPTYDNPSQQTEMKNSVESAMAGYDFKYRSHRVEGGKGAPCYIWNAVALQAFNDGCDYLYQLNDDVQFLTAGWLEKFLDILRSNKRMPNFGMTGPFDVGYDRAITQSFCHRTHMEIFGYYYPPAFKNWYSDDWASHVYREESTTIAHPMKIRNVNPGGTRYYPDYDAKELLSEELAKSCQVVGEWLKSKHADEGWKCEKEDYWWER